MLENNPTPSQAAVDLTVIAEEIRKSFTLGFDKAVEMFKVVTQPAPPPEMVMAPGFGEPANEGEYGPGTLDMGSLWQMPPEAREAILARHGLQVYHEAPAEPDPTHENLRTAIKDDGGIPPTTEEGE